MAKAARRSVAFDPSSPTNRKKLRSLASAPIPTTQSKLIGQNEPTVSSDIYKNVNRTIHSDEKSLSNGNGTTPITNGLSDQERIRLEFYATYDVMTGIRIAATLGGFFGLMVFLVVYKSRSQTNRTLKVLKDPKIAACAEAVIQEEEEKKIQQAIEALGIELMQDEYKQNRFKRPRMMSLGSVSASSAPHPAFRFSSVGGGYSSLIDAPRRYSYCGVPRRRRTSDASRNFSAYKMGGSLGIDEYFIESDGDEADDEFDHIIDDSLHPNSVHLSVPSKVGSIPVGQESRRSSSITCCSTESSFNERRCSAITLGINSLAPISSSNSSRRPSEIDLRGATVLDTNDISVEWNYYYPDINVINPTPKTSPCPNERFHYNLNTDNKLTRNKSNSFEDYRYGRQKRLLKQEPIEYDEIEEVNNGNQVNVDVHVQRDAKYVYEDDNLNLLQNELLKRRAPLASLNSINLASEIDLKSLTSDSVFIESLAETDDDLEQFSTDTDEITDTQSPVKVPVQPKVTEKRVAVSEYGNVDYLPSSSKGNRESTVNKIQIQAIIENYKLPQDTVITMPMGDIGESDYNIVKPGCSNSNNNDINKPSILIQDSIIHCNVESNKNPIQSIELIPRKNSIKTKQRQRIKRANMKHSSDSTSSSSECLVHKRRSNVDTLSKDSSEVRTLISNKGNDLDSTSVILELPVITAQELSMNDDPMIDPSLPGSSRKWSKETLF